MRLWVAPRGLHIEPAVLGDAEQLARVHGRAFYRGWSEAEFAAYLADPRRTPAYAAMDRNRRIAGFALLRIAADEAELMTIAVAPNWRGKGVGAALMRAAFADLMMSPVKHMFLEVEAANAPAIALYKGFGFADVGRREGYYETKGGEKASALVMRCSLD